MPVHYEDDKVQITKVVVGPMVNNVFVVRCVETGDSVLIDAADEPEVLLPLCEELNVGDVLTTHGHRDHIQAVPAVRRAGHRVGVAQGDAGAKLHTGRFEVASLTRSWHGLTGGAAALTMAAGRRGYGPTVPGGFALPAPYAYRCPIRRCSDACDLSCLEAGFDLFDRSFDLQIQILKERGWQPSLALGFRDFLDELRWGAHAAEEGRVAAPEPLFPRLDIDSEAS